MSLSFPPPVRTTLRYSLLSPRNALAEPGKLSGDLLRKALALASPPALLSLLSYSPLLVSCRQQNTGTRILVSRILGNPVPSGPLWRGALSQGYNCVACTSHSRCLGLGRRCPSMTTFRVLHRTPQAAVTNQMGLTSEVKSICQGQSLSGVTMGEHSPSIPAFRAK